MGIICKLLENYENSQDKMDLHVKFCSQEKKIHAYDHWLSPGRSNGRRLDCPIILLSSRCSFCRLQCCLICDSSARHHSGYVEQLLQFNERAYWCTITFDRFTISSESAQAKRVQFSERERCMCSAHGQHLPAWTVTFPAEEFETSLVHRLNRAPFMEWCSCHTFAADSSWCSERV